MGLRDEPVVRNAEPGDVAAIRRFGEQHIPSHYAPLIGAEAADRQVRDWWNETVLGAAVGKRLVVVAELGGAIVGVGQCGRSGPDHVVYKLYVDQHRNRGLGVRLLDALIGQLPPDRTEPWASAQARFIRAASGKPASGPRRQIWPTTRPSSSAVQAASASSAWRNSSTGIGSGPRSG